MSSQPRLLLVGEVDPLSQPLLDLLGPVCEIVRPEGHDPWVCDPWRSTAAALVVGNGAWSVPTLTVLSEVLRFLPEGVVVLDTELRVRWCNERLCTLIGQAEPVGRHFHDLLGSSEILGPDFSPFYTALGAGVVARSIFRVGEKLYLEVLAAPVHLAGAEFPTLVVSTVRDVSADVLQRQKLNAIHRAGMELGDLSPEELTMLSVEERIELLKQKIIQITKDVLEFETVEIRLLDKHTRKLEPLLDVGMADEAAHRQLSAEPQNNGVTGFVAATGKSYHCPDTSADPLYLPGAPNARSSLTVPLILHEEVLGTFNVESRTVGGFSDDDLQFLELFCRDVAIAINTFELLAVEKHSTATESTERVLRELAKPVDEILNDTTWILDKYIGHDPSVTERLQRVLKHARSLRKVVHKVGETIAPTPASATNHPQRHRPLLRGKRILVVDEDDSVRLAAHEMLGKVGCEIETAHSGEEAEIMARSTHYDVVITDIRLTDMTGFECFCKLRQIDDRLQVILMTGYGYDPGHSIVKARQQGLKSVLYKPFRLDQLFGEVEKAVSAANEPPAPPAGQ